MLTSTGGTSGPPSKEEKMPDAPAGYKLTDEARGQKIAELTKQILKLVEERDKLMKGEG